ncbi:MAG TPA: PQQ-binding-like beta-propeller repeat protein [Bryobacteraceae bacterium]|jgi:polyvinyl alcohol dehydrogenase (cytochrome)|nr:PQQ-binding-like beta-propeller repeat protein [Bryobacteraceae bacterium]
MNSRVVAFLVVLSPSLVAAPVSGEAVYQKRCAGCHDAGSRAPSRELLKARSVLSIKRTLDFGIMATVAGPMRRDERDAVADWLGVAGANPTPPAKAFCADRSVKITTMSGWNGWSASPGNTRYQPAGDAGLTVDGVKRLKLKWAYGYDGDAVAFSQPTVLGHEVFMGSASGLVQALSLDTGCVKWVFQSTGPVRSAIVAVPSGAKHTLLFGDQVGWFYALDAETGRQLWKKRPDPHESVRLTGAPTVYQGTVYVPVSSWEENRPLSPEYPCCTFRGSIVAYRISDGSQLWKTYTIPDKPHMIGKNNAGIEEWGPSGGSVWGSPTLDAKRGILYATTGDNFSSPPTPMSDSVLALDLKSGRILWAKQTTPGDIWTSGCGARGDCPGPDFDFGSSVLLEKLPNGRDILLASQKSGVVYGLDPERKGELLWQIRVGKGGINGGVQWGMASDGQNVYAATSDLVRGGSNPDKTDPRPLPLDSTAGGGLTAIRITTGEKVWFTPPTPCGPRPGCSPAQSGAVSAIPGVVFSGSLDGHLRAYTAEEGKVVWDFDTVRDYETVNGVKAHGGAINGPGAVVVGGMVLINSGYGRNSGLAGNVLLAFAPEE